jgi:ADP-ribose pyrophosphatase YjhB (NUDIX family)
VFLDPKVAAVVLVTSGDKLVLVRRGVEPEMGRWSFPSGFMNRGEVVEGAAKREVKEETGLDIELDGLVGVYSSQDSPVVLAVYSATAIGGTPQAGHDAAEVRLFPPDGLPDLPFPHDRQILDDWRAMAQQSASG